MFFLSSIPVPWSILTISELWMVKTHKSIQIQGFRDETMDVKNCSPPHESIFYKILNWHFLGGKRVVKYWLLSLWIILHKQWEEGECEYKYEIHNIYEVFLIFITTKPFLKHLLTYCLSLIRKFHPSVSVTDLIIKITFSYSFESGG